MKKLFFFLLLVPFLVFAQEKGTHFEHASSWDKVKAMAKEKNMRIFVDCYTTWCGPCKKMTEKIFPQENVGTFFNANFVNLKLQMDQTKTDSEEVQAWYPEAQRFEKDYAIKAYPTFLIFNSKGELEHRILGGEETGEKFIETVQQLLNSETEQMILQKFESQPDNADIALKTWKIASKSYNLKLFQEAFDRYVNLLGVDSVLTPQNIDMLVEEASSSSSPVFKFMKDNKSRVDPLLAPRGNSTNKLLGFTLIYENVLLIGLAEDFETLEKVRQELNKMHPEINLIPHLVSYKSQILARQKNWLAYKDLINEDLVYSESITSRDALNGYAWTIFEQCSDPIIIQAALAWSQKNLADAENPKYINTYSNLLYKSGDKKAAIKWQKKAVTKAEEADKANYQAALQKMLKGQPSWDLPANK